MATKTKQKRKQLEDDEAMFECDVCGAMTTRKHRSYKECFLSLSREAESCCIKMIWFLRHIKEDDEIRRNKNRVIEVVKLFSRQR